MTITQIRVWMERNWTQDRATSGSVPELGHPRPVPSHLSPWAATSAAGMHCSLRTCSIHGRLKLSGCNTWVTKPARPGFSAARHPIVQTSAPLKKHLGNQAAPFVLGETSEFWLHFVQNPQEIFNQSISRCGTRNWSLCESQ